MQCYTSSNNGHLIFVGLPHHLQDQKRIVSKTVVNKTAFSFLTRGLICSLHYPADYTKLTYFSMADSFSLPFCLFIYLFVRDQA